MSGIVALIDYSSGNLRSAEKALERAAREAASGHEIVVTSDPDVVAQAERIVLPGVGAFGDCMQGLRAIDGMIAALEEAVQRRGVPFLGICVGMQLLADVGHEFGDHAGLGWVSGEVVKLQTSSLPSREGARECEAFERGRGRSKYPSPDHSRTPLAPDRPLPQGEGESLGLKIPHMGWNELTIVRPHPLLEGIGEHPHAYFVHSYEFRAREAADIVATTDYGGAVTVMIARGNIAGTQFHPEKSQAVGLTLLGNFLRWKP